MTYSDFRQLLERYSIKFIHILDLILLYNPCKNSSPLPLFIINIDETNSLFDRKSSDFLKLIINTLVESILAKYFIFPVLSGTHGVSQYEAVEKSGSGAHTNEIDLPLFEVKHAEDIILELANRGKVGCVIFDDRVSN